MLVYACSSPSYCSTGCTTQLTQLECLRVQEGQAVHLSSAEPQYSHWFFLTAACKTMVADCSCNNLWIHTLGHPRVDPVGKKCHLEL